MEANFSQKEFALAKNKLYSAAYNEEKLKFFTEKETEKIAAFQKTHEANETTPLHTLQNLAAYYGFADIKVKDESFRFGLNAFKVLGGIYAIGKYVAERLGKDMNHVSFDELKSLEVRDKIGQITFISATDGNHGKGVAWAARELGQKAVIYLPKGSA